jgi:hypothetical protein
MAHSSGISTWRFRHRETGKTLDVRGHTAHEALCCNTAAFVVAFGGVPTWSQFDEPLNLDEPPSRRKRTRKRRRTASIAAKFESRMEPERFISGSGKA